MRYLGIDYGTKKVGIAISDSGGSFAIPYKVLENDNALQTTIKEICKKEGISTIVLGESVDYKNRPNPIMKEITTLRKNLEELLDIPIVFQKEILTTKEAERLQGSNDATDASAAALILRSFLEQRSNK